MVFKWFWPSKASHFRLNVDQNFMCFLDPLKNDFFAPPDRPWARKSHRIEFLGSFLATPGIFMVPIGAQNHPSGAKSLQNLYEGRSLLPLGALHVARCTF